MQVDPCRPGGMRFRDPFAQRLPRTLACGTPAETEGLDGGPGSPLSSAGSDGGGDVESLDLRDVGTPQP